MATPILTAIRAAEQAVASASEALRVARMLIEPPAEPERDACRSCGSVDLQALEANAGEIRICRACGRDQEEE